MTAKNIKIVETDRTQYMNYQKKAEEFYLSMLQAEKMGHWIVTLKYPARFCLLRFMIAVGLR